MHPAPTPAPAPEPPGGTGPHRSASILGRIAQQPVPELGIVLVGVVEGVRPVSGLQFSGAHRVLEPAVVGLAGELEDPQGHRDRDLVGGELGHERVHHFFGSPACRLSPSLRIDHLQGPKEPLLWVPDAVCGAVTTARVTSDEYLKILGEQVAIVQI
ncbi:hypothetical protein [Micrococcus sp.]|uniref:hypothetical protein n=1 Tax=Micrococcus sp. TaxID=1271 RepID=UPI002A910F1A|nr:hypothetical protein [Micrococcus sp.]MDY6056110.1 hypothetical protein [Micrococcus sp.]